jgi:hypothetical protein
MFFLKGFLFVAKLVGNMFKFFFFFFFFWQVPQENPLMRILNIN